MAYLSPLFDRLSDENMEIPFEQTPKKFSSLQEFQTSITEDLSRLLNTRLSIYWKNFSDNNYITPYAYGVNVTEAIYSDSIDDIQKVETRIAKAIERFESRLSNVKVSIQRIGDNKSSLFINIDATVPFADKETILSFPIVIQP